MPDEALAQQLQRPLDADPQVLADQQKRLQDELEKRSEDLRKRLEQTSAAGGATPAPTTPAPTPAPR